MGQQVTDRDWPYRRHGIVQRSAWSLSNPHLRNGGQELRQRLVERQLAKAAAGSDEAVPASQSAERFKEIAAIIRTQVNRTLDALPQRPVGISVDARTQQVKEVNQGGSFCLSLKLNVTEEGLDMLFEDPEPGQDKLPALSRLVPE